MLAVGERRDRCFLRAYGTGSSEGSVFGYDVPPSGDIQLSKMRYRLLLFGVNSGMPPITETPIILLVLLTVDLGKVFLKSFLLYFL